MCELPYSPAQIQVPAGCRTSNRKQFELNSRQLRKTKSKIEITSAFYKSLAMACKDEDYGPAYLCCTVSTQESSPIVSPFNRRPLLAMCRNDAKSGRIPSANLCGLGLSAARRQNATRLKLPLSQPALLLIAVGIEVPASEATSVSLIRPHPLSALNTPARYQDHILPPLSVSDTP